LIPSAAVEAGADVGRGGITMSGEQGPLGMNKELAAGDMDSDLLSSVGIDMNC